MNWTGGRLQRHSHSNTLTHRQKQHFAKVRTRLQHGALSSSPFRPSFFQPGEAGASALERVSVGEGPPPKRQKTLDQYETVAPLAQRLTWMKPRRPTHRHISRRTTHDNTNATTSPCSHPSVPRSGATLASSPQAVVVSHGKANAERQPHRPKVYDQQNGSRRKAHASDGAFTDDVVERERRRLLADRDWVSLALSRPLRRRVSPTGERDTIRKRHRTNRVKPARGVRDDAARTPFVWRADGAPGGPFMSGALVDDADIRIRIGTDALATQSSAQINDSHGAGNTLTPSDPMLFDLEDPLQDAQPIHAEDFLNGDSHAPQQEKEDTPNLTNLHETGTASRKEGGGAETDVVDDVDKLLQELEGCSSRYPAAPASSPVATHATYHDDADHEDDRRDQAQVSDAQDENLVQNPTSQQEMESAREDIGLDQAETCARTKGPANLRDLTREPFRLSFKSPPYLPSIDERQLNTVLVPPEPRSTGSVVLHYPGTGSEGFDDVRWRALLEITSDGTDESPDARRTGSECQKTHPSVADVAPPTAFRDGSTDRDVRREHSAEQLIGDAGHRANQWSRRFDGNHSTDRSPNLDSTVAHATAGASMLPCSSSLHPQASASGPDGPGLGPHFASPHQTLAPAQDVLPPVAQGWIGDADTKDEAEAIWRKFVLGGDGVNIGDPKEECVSPERAIRSTRSRERGFESSVFVDVSAISAGAGAAPPSPAVAHLHSASFRYGAADTAAASAGKAMPSAEAQASESMAFVEVDGSTRAAASPVVRSRCLPAFCSDADAHANQASDNANTVAATAGESPSEDASLDRRQRIDFTRPKAFVGAVAAGAATMGGGAKAGNGLTGTSHVARRTSGRRAVAARYRIRGNIDAAEGRERSRQQGFRQ